MPGFVDSHTHLVFAGDRAARVRRPDGAGSATTAAGSPRPSPPPARADDAALRALLRRPDRRAARPGHDDRRDQERLRPDRRRRGARAAPGRRGDGGDDLPRRPRRPAESPDRGGVPRAGHRADARRLRAARPVGRRVLRAREPARLRRRRGPRGARGRARAPGSGCGCTATSSAPGPGSQLAVELGAASVDHCTYLSDADVDALAGGDHGRDPAAGRRVLHSLALPGRPPAARRRACRRAGDRLQPRHCYSSSMPFVIALAVREMGLTPGGGAARGDRGAARALRRNDIGGSRAGARADLTVLDAPTHVHLAYRRASRSPRARPRGELIVRALSRRSGGRCRRMISVDSARLIVRETARPVSRSDPARPRRCGRRLGPAPELPSRPVAPGRRGRCCCASASTSTSRCATAKPFCRPPGSPRLPAPPANACPVDQRRS